MLVERLVWEVEPDHQDEFVEILAEYLHDPKNPMKRVYTPRIGVLGTVVAELEYNNLAEWELAWNEWKSPEKSGDVDREQELSTMREATVWRLVE